jgi:hypothetical protein
VSLDIALELALARPVAVTQPLNALLAQATCSTMEVIVTLLVINFTTLLRSILSPMPTWHNPLVKCRHYGAQQVRDQTLP